MTVHVETVLLNSLAQRGDRYVFGAEAAATNPDPDRFDCSELVEWACARAGISPRVPDGAYNQWRATKLAGGRVLSVAEGIRTRGALLFVGDGTGTDRDAITHVAWSLGDGTTIEARGSKWGVGCWAAAGRFNFAGLLPGIDYGATTAPPLVMPAQGSPLKNLQQLVGASPDGIWGPQTEARCRAQMISWEKGPARKASAGNSNRALVRWLQSQGNRRFNDGMSVDGVVGPATNHLIVVQLRQADGICGPNGYRSAAA